MISLVFLVCTLNGCFSASPPEIFQTKEDCETVATLMLERSSILTEQGQIEKHTVEFACVEWGVPA